MRSAVVPRFSSKIPGFILFLILKPLSLRALRTRRLKGFRKMAKVLDQETEFLV